MIQWLNSGGIAMYVILGFSVFLFLVSWLVTSELGKARLIFNWLMVLFLVGIGILGYGIHVDRKGR